MNVDSSSARDSGGHEEGDAIRAKLILSGGEDRTVCGDDRSIRAGKGHDEHHDRGHNVAGVCAHELRSDRPPKVAEAFRHVARPHHGGPGHEMKNMATAAIILVYRA